MTHKIDGKLLGLEGGGEYELAPGCAFENIDTRKGYLVLKRVPGKSELSKWAEYHYSPKGTEVLAAQDGFMKAIEVAEAETANTQQMGDCYTCTTVLNKLKKFAGIK